MNFSAFFLLLCTASSSYARVLSQAAVDSSVGTLPGIGCEVSNQHGIEDPDCLKARPANDFPVNLTAVSRVKTVIPDLTSQAYQYEWFDMDGLSYLEWNGIQIDVLSVSESVANELTVNLAFNRDLDKNPNKVALRDVLLSYWRYRKGRQVKDLETIVYENVMEEDMRSTLPEIYDLLGREMHQDMMDQANFQLSPRASGDEQVAYFKLLNGCPFPAGAKKMLAEYTEFENRALGTFEFSWMGGNTLNFAVHFSK